MIASVRSEPGESAQERYERAIVADSVAAAQEESISGVGNPVAKRVARKRAEEASGELNRALDALQEQKRFGGG